MVGENSSELKALQKTSDDQANTIARLENDIKKLGDSNASPRIIQKGNQKHPKYQKNAVKVAATLQIEKPEEQPKKRTKK